MGTILKCIRSYCVVVHALIPYGLRVYGYMYRDVSIIGTQRHPHLMNRWYVSLFLVKVYLTEIAAHCIFCQLNESQSKV